MDVQELPFLEGDHVTADVGTGLVHTAPAHGQEDFQKGMQYGLPVVIFFFFSFNTVRRKLWVLKITHNCIFRTLLLMRQEDTHLKQGHFWKEKEFMWMQKIQVFQLFIGSSLQHITCVMSILEISLYSLLYYIYYIGLSPI